MTLRDLDVQRFHELVLAARKGTLICAEVTERDTGLPCAVLAEELPDGTLLALAVIPAAEPEDFVTEPKANTETAKIVNDADLKGEPS